MPNYTDTQLRMANAHAGQLLHAVNRIVAIDPDMTPDLIMRAVVCGVGVWLGAAHREHKASGCDTALEAYLDVMRQGAEAGLQAVTAEEAA